MDVHSRLQELKSANQLPSPKGAALQVLLLCQRDDVSNQEVVYAIQTDPALSARLIKLANAPAAHQIRPVISVMDAVAVLGLNTVRQVVLGLSLVDGSRNLACTKFDYHEFWSHSLLAGITAQNLVMLKNIGTVPPEEIFVLGLLSKIGSLAFASAYPQDYAVILGQLEKNPDTKLNSLESAKFGFDHNQLSKEMLADWRLPLAFQTAVLHYEDPEHANFAEGSRDWTMLHLLHVADFLASVCLAQGVERNRLISRLVFKATRLGIETDVLTGLFNRVVQQWYEWSKLFNIRVTEVPPFEQLIAVAPLAPDSSDAGKLPQNIENTYKLRILLVDDDRAVLMIMKMLLDTLGHTVALALNGKEALSVVESFKPQVIMTDWIMPEMDGIEFCKTLRRNATWRNIYVFMMTSQESTDRLVEAFEAGANDYMTKPINPKVLGARLSAGQRVVQLQEELEHEREQLHKFSEELALSNQRLQQLALTDELTELPNRRFANEFLDRQWASAQRNDRALSCMMVDIDFFKQVNDTYGHRVGDDVLKQVAAALKHAVRKADVVCRLGGEEFLVICPEVSATDIYAYAERLRETVAALNFHDTHAKSFKLTVSIGVASRKTAVSTAEMLLQLADKRLYQAKETGRNRTVAH